MPVSKAVRRPRRSSEHLTLVATPTWQPLDAITLACKQAVTDSFCALPDVDERAAVAAFMALDPPPSVCAKLLGDPVARRVVAFAFGTGAAAPDRIAQLRSYVHLGRETRHLIGLGRALAPAVPIAWTSLLLDELRLVWHAQDLRLRGDARAFDVVLAEVRRETAPATEMTPDGARTVRRVRTTFGATLDCVVLEHGDGTCTEEYRWEFPDDVDPVAWRDTIDQVTVRQIQLESRARRIRDAYFGGASPHRTRTVRWHGFEIEHRTLGTLPNYEPMVAREHASGV